MDQLGRAVKLTQTCPAYLPTATRGAQCVDATQYVNGLTISRVDTRKKRLGLLVTIASYACANRETLGECRYINFE